MPAFERSLRFRKNIVELSEAMKSLGYANASVVRMTFAKSILLANTFAASVVLLGNDGSRLFGSAT